MKNLTFYLICISFALISCEKEQTDILTYNDSPKLLDKMLYNDSLFLDYTYNDDNLLIQLDQYSTDGGLIYTFTFQYDSLNRLSKKIYYGYEETYIYNADNQLVEMERYYEPTQKTWKTTYSYKNNRISSGKNYYNGEFLNYIRFSYDSRGNTTERTEYDFFEDEEMILNQRRFQYDDKINPRPAFATLEVDVVQNNNPTYTYMFNVFMSSLPPEFNITYDYNSLDLPVKSYSENITYSSSIANYEFIYEDKH